MTYFIGGGNIFIKIFLNTNIFSALYIKRDKLYSETFKYA